MVVSRRLAAAAAVVLLTTACSTSSPAPTPATTSTAGSRGVIVTSRSPTPSTAAAGRASIAVSPATSLYDQPVAVTISGLPRGAAVSVTARATDSGGAVWKSTAEFTADARGRVSLSQPAADGSDYTGSNDMGLFVNMSSATSPATIFAPADINGFPIDVQAVVAGKVVAQAVVRRVGAQSAGVRKTRETVAATGIYGTLFMPRTVTPDKPALVLLGGSEGGLATAYVASLLAARGYPSLALAYFKEPGLPAELSNIPLEYFVKGITLLAAQPGVDRTKIIVYGVSRGSEAALLLGAHFPTLVHGVVAGSPSAVVFGSLPEGHAAWTLSGKALPFASDSDFDSGDPDPADAPKSVIPVEQIKGPIFTICGGSDALWHSCGYAAAITARLNAHHVSYPRTALVYPNAGHLVGGMNVFSDMSGTEGHGGTVNANAMGSADGYFKLLSWLAHQ